MVVCAKVVLDSLFDVVAAQIQVLVELHKRALRMLLDLNPRRSNLCQGFDALFEVV